MDFLFVSHAVRFMQYTYSLGVQPGGGFIQHLNNSVCERVLWCGIFHC